MQWKEVENKMTKEYELSWKRLDDIERKPVHLSLIKALSTCRIYQNGEYLGERNVKDSHRWGHEPYENTLIDLAKKVAQDFPYEQGDKERIIKEEPFFYLNKNIEGAFSEDSRSFFAQFIKIFSKKE